MREEGKFLWQKLSLVVVAIDSLGHLAPMKDINEIPEGAGWNALKALRAVNKEVIQAMQFLAMTLLYFRVFNFYRFNYFHVSSQGMR